MLIPTAEETLRVLVWPNAFGKLWGRGALSLRHGSQNWGCAANLPLKCLNCLSWVISPRLALCTSHTGAGPSEDAPSGLRESFHVIPRKTRTGSGDWTSPLGLACLAL